MIKHPSMPSGGGFNICEFITDLKDTNGVVFGKSITRYEIRKRKNVTNLESVPGYTVIMKQRICIPNANKPVPGMTNQDAYTNYPAILFNSVEITANNNGSILLQQVFPRTLNSAVSTSSNSSDGKTSSNMNQSTNGSSNTNVNTFGVGLSGGFFGAIPMGSLSLEYSHSWEKSSYNSSTSGSSSGTETNQGIGDSMSIKDWSSYAYLDDDSVSPAWIWGQTFPWDVIQYNQTADGNTVSLPQFVKDRLLDGTLVLPPSQLSQFGLDFTMQAMWLVDFPQPITGDEFISVAHKTQSYTASHQLSGSSVSATLQSSSNAATTKYADNNIDLSSLALNVINGAAPGSGAAIGFTGNPFTYAPTKYSDSFKILSPANNVQVTGTGFDGAMTTDFSTAPKLTVTFKIADYSVNYSLLLMHWIGKGSGACIINWSINDNQSGTMYVDSEEGMGANNNTSQIELRNTDFTSINFHDYLIIGTNRVTLSIQPIDTTKQATYSLFAMAVGEIS